MPLHLVPPLPPGQNPAAPRLDTYLALWEEAPRRLAPGHAIQIELRGVDLAIFETLLAEPATPTEVLRTIAHRLDTPQTQEYALRAQALLLLSPDTERERIPRLIARLLDQADALTSSPASQALILSACLRVERALNLTEHVATRWSALKALLPRVTGEVVWGALTRDAAATGALGALLAEAPWLTDHLTPATLQRLLPMAEEGEVSVLRRALRSSGFHLAQTVVMAQAGRAQDLWLNTLKPMPADAALARAWCRVALLALDAHMSADRDSALALLPRLLEAASCRFTETLGAQALLMARLAARLDGEQRDALLARVVPLLKKMPRKTEGFEDDALALLDTLMDLERWPIVFEIVHLLKVTTLDRGLSRVASRYAAAGDHHAARVLLDPIPRGVLLAQGVLECLWASAVR
jgi:hypothetical protein